MISVPRMGPIPSLVKIGRDATIIGPSGKSMTPVMLFSALPCFVSIARLRPFFPARSLEERAFPRHALDQSSFRK